MNTTTGSWMTLKRFAEDKAHGTVGALEMRVGKWAENGEQEAASEWQDSGEVVFSCHTMENPWVDANNDGISDRNVSRVPAGAFLLGRDDAGRFVNRYRDRFGHTFVPMIQDGQIPGRSQILFHIGNNVENTHGCILLGRHRFTKGTSFNPDSVPVDRYFYVNSSTDTYKEFFQNFMRCRPFKIFIHDPESGGSEG